MFVPVGTVITSPNGDRWFREGPGAWRYFVRAKTNLSTEASLCADDVSGFIASRQDGDKYVVQYPVFVPPNTSTNLVQFTNLLQATGVSYTVDMNANPGPVLHLTDSTGNTLSVVAFDANGNFISWKAA